ncbi:MAG TPA: type II toxin-antitoxin system VapC family toxin [Thermoplasmata archaeon]
MKSKLIDLNILAIFLVGDHPGHRYVDPVVSSGLAGEYRLLMPDQLPLRARWVLTKHWGIDSKEADRAVEDFLEHRRVRYVGAARTTMQKAFELAKTLRHDVYDTFYLALAMDHSAPTVLTTDRDFRGLCKKVDLEYENPVPEDVLRRFEGFRKTR